MECKLRGCVGKLEKKLFTAIVKHTSSESEQRMCDIILEKEPKDFTYNEIEFMSGLIDVSQYYEPEYTIKRHLGLRVICKDGEPMEIEEILEALRGEQDE